MVHTGVFLCAHTNAHFCGKTHFRLRQAVLFPSTAPTDPSNHPIAFPNFCPYPFCRPCFFSYHPFRCHCAGFRTIHRRIVGCGRETRRDYGPDDHAASVPLLRPGSSLPSKNGVGGGAGSRFGAGVLVVAAVSTIPKTLGIGWSIHSIVLLIMRRIASMMPSTVIVRRV